jgi:deoxycytidine triphosphate deaminase
LCHKTCKYANRNRTIQAIAGWAHNTEGDNRLPMSVYSNKQIRQAISTGHIVCHPFEPQHINPTSLDVTLGYYYYRIDSSDERTIYNPFDREDVERYFDGPYKAMPHGQWCAFNGFKPIAGIPDNHPIIALKPGERILAHTHEFFGITSPGACEIRSKVAWRHNGIAVCCDAGWIPPGDINRLTLEIYNLNRHKMLLLPVGERIAQAVFYDTGAVEGNYVQGQDGSLNGSHHPGTTLQTIIKSWSPSAMLPQAYRDVRQLPTKIEGMSHE